MLSSVRGQQEMHTDTSNYKSPSLDAITKITNHTFVDTQPNVDWHPKKCCFCPQAFFLWMAKCKPGAPDSQRVPLESRSFHCTVQYQTLFRSYHITEWDSFTFILSVLPVLWPILTPQWSCQRLWLPIWRWASTKLLISLMLTRPFSATDIVALCWRDMTGPEEWLNATRMQNPTQDSMSVTQPTV